MHLEVNKHTPYLYDAPDCRSVSTAEQHTIQWIYLQVDKLTRENKRKQ